VNEASTKVTQNARAATGVLTAALERAAKVLKGIDRL